MSGSLTPGIDSRLGAIDGQIQTLRFQEQALDGVRALKDSLPQAREALNKLGKDLKGDSYSLKDLVELKIDKAGQPTVVKKDGALDPLKVDGTQVPADLVSTAIDAQTAVEEAVAPFADHSSKLLGSLQKVKEGLDKGSAMAETVSKAIQQVERAWRTFDRAMTGDGISGDELIEAFDDYFAGTLEALSKTVGTVPGMGPFLEQYSKAISSVVPDLKTISASRRHLEKALQDERDRALGRESTTSTTGADAPPETGLRDSIRQQIRELEAQRLELLNDKQRSEAESAKKEIDGLERAADQQVGSREGHNLTTASNEAQTAVANAVQAGSALDRARKKGASDAEIDTLEKKYAGWVEQATTYLHLAWRMRSERIAALTELIRAHRHVLQEWDLRELLNRYPQLAPVVAELRGTEHASAAVGSGGGKKALIGAGVGALLVAGVVAVTQLGGDDCEEQQAAVQVLAMAANTPVAQGIDCPPEAALDAPIGEAITGEDASDPGDVDDDPDTSLRRAATAGTSPLDMWLEDDLTVGSLDPSIGSRLDSSLDDATGDHIFSIPGQQPGFVVPEVDMVRVWRWQGLLPDEPWSEAFGNTAFPCGRSDDTVTVVCPDGTTDLPGPGEYAIVGVDLAGPIGDVQPGTQLIHAYVVDRDGDPANDWQPQGQYTWDYFQDADTWFQLIGDVGPSGISWRIDVSEVTTSQEIVPADLPVRALVTASTVVWIVPTDAIPPDAPYRVSAFAHDGTYAPDRSGGDVPGPDPTGGLHN